MRFAKRVFQVAGIYGLLVMVPQFFSEGWTSQNFPPAITHPENYYGFIGVTTVFQLIFLLISRDPARYRPLMPIAFLEKWSFLVAVIILVAMGRTSSFLLPFALIDGTLGVLFLVAYRKTAEPAPTAQSRTVARGV